MADPTATALLALTAASAFSTIGNIYTQSRAIKAQGSYEAGVYEQNARLAQMQAEDAIERGDQDARTYQLQVKRLMGSQRARLAAQGLDLGYGSALDIQEDTAMLGAMDALTIRNNAYREAWGYKVQALDYSGRAAFTSLTAKSKASQTILTGGMQLANLGTQYYQLSQIKP